MGSNHPSKQYCEPGLGTRRGAWEGRTIWNSEAGRPPRDRVLGSTLDKEHAWKPPISANRIKADESPSSISPKIRKSGNEIEMAVFSSGWQCSTPEMHLRVIQSSLWSGIPSTSLCCPSRQAAPVDASRKSGMQDQPWLSPHQSSPSTLASSEINPETSWAPEFRHPEELRASRQGRFSWSLLQNLFKTILRVLPIGVSEKQHLVETIQFPLPRHDEIPLPKGVSLPILSTAQNSQIPTSFP